MEIYLSGITTLVAVLGLVYSLFESVRDRKIRTKESLKDQAKKIACWIKKEIPESIVENSPDTTTYQIYTVNNNSDLPIYNVFLFSVFNKDEDSIKNIKNAIEKHQYSYYEIIAPGQLDSTPIINNHSAGGGRGIPCLTFIDASGNAWFRSKYGKLELIKNYENKLAEFGLYRPYVSALPDE